MKANGSIPRVQLQHIPRVKERQTKAKDSTDETRYNADGLNERGMRCNITDDGGTISYATRMNATANSSKSNRMSAYYIVDTFFIYTLRIEKYKNQYIF